MIISALEPIELAFLFLLEWFGTGYSKSTIEHAPQYYWLQVAAAGHRITCFGIYTVELGWLAVVICGIPSVIPSRSPSRRVGNFSRYRGKKGCCIKAPCSKNRPTMIRLPRIYWLNIHYSWYRSERGDKGVASGTEFHARTKTCACYRAGGLADTSCFCDGWQNLISCVVWPATRWVASP